MCVSFRGKIKKSTNYLGSFDHIYDGNCPFEIKRLYLIKPFKHVRRDWHGHQLEWKVFVVLHGCVQFVTYEFASRENRREHTLRGGEYLVVGPGHFNNFIALTNDVKILGLSNLTIEDSVNDDLRFKWSEYLKPEESR